MVPIIACVLTRPAKMPTTIPAIAPGPGEFDVLLGLAKGAEVDDTFGAEPFALPPGGLLQLVQFSHSLAPVLVPERCNVVTPYGPRIYREKGAALVDDLERVRARVI